jgi:hypothetical protein
MDTDRFKKYGKYLPSRKFVFVMGGGLAVLVLILLISNYFGSHGGFDRSARGDAPVTADGTVKDVVLRDSNENGIPDWEESLWGFDPSGNGEANKKAIDAKKSANGIVPDTSGVPLSETDKFSQSLLSTILALQQSGTLTEEAITNLSASVGDSLDAKHANPETYAMANLTITPTNGPAAKAAYKKALKALLDRYADLDLGSELEVIAAGLESGNADTLRSLGPVAEAYGSIAKEIVKIPTPPGVAPYALVLANASAEMAAALPQVENIYDDVLDGMVGVDDYIHGSNAADAASASIRAYFES